MEECDSSEFLKNGNQIPALYSNLLLRLAKLFKEMPIMEIADFCSRMSWYYRVDKECSRKLMKELIGAGIMHRNGGKITVTLELIKTENKDVV